MEWKCEVLFIFVGVVLFVYIYECDCNCGVMCFYFVLRLFFRKRVSGKSFFKKIFFAENIFRYLVRTENH
jgi:hypothetical protein